jgi:CubicO group peptidase (beta-lactamase class C family)
MLSAITIRQLLNMSSGITYRWHDPDALSPGRARRVSHGLRRAWAGLREFDADCVELQGRLLLLNRPGEEDLLHWTAEGTLHGRTAAPRRRHDRWLCDHACRVQWRRLHVGISSRT